MLLATLILASLVRARSGGWHPADHVFLFSQARPSRNYVIPCQSKSIRFAATTLAVGNTTLELGMKVPAFQEDAEGKQKGFQKDMFYDSTKVWGRAGLVHTSILLFIHRIHFV